MCAQGAHDRIKGEWMSNGKRHYWSLLFDRYHPGLVAFLGRRVRRAADAPDLAQEVYLRFLRADRADLIRNPEAYLYTIALNLVREQAVLDQRWKHTVDATESAADPALVDLRTPEEDIDRAARLHRIEALIETLPPKFQAVLILQYRDGLTYEQIGTRLGVTTHTVKKYVVQGLALCRKRLSRSEGRPG